MTQSTTGSSASQESRAPQESKSALGSSASPSRSTLRVLVVDDEDASRSALASAVRMLGYACREASNGSEALALHGASRADVILSDWRMPLMDGAELCRQVRSLDGVGYTHFVLLIAFDDREHFLRGMAAGADGYHVKPIDVDELKARLECAERLVGLYRDLTDQNAQLRRDSEAAMRAARIDPLTDVRNRLGLTDDLEAAKARVERYGHRYCVAICDVDDFKRYNDRYGHLAGDEVLRGVAGTMRKHLRQGDTLYRYGGEEFLVLLPEQHEGDACAALERVRLEVERLGIPIFDSPRDKEGSPGAPRLLTISVGVAALGAGEAVDAWIARADRALFQAKRAGKNRVELAVAPSNASHRSSPDVAS